MSEVDLGFPEARENSSLWLSNRYFPSKIGGRPAWLELDTIPSMEKLQCKNCTEPMTFLCQLYAPGEEEHNFHRSLYVFVCREAACQKPNDAKNFLVLRSQLPLKNDFYPSVAPVEEDDPLPEILPKKKLCLACGCPGPLTCGSCRNANYCSVKHQRAMWPSHKKTCSINNQVPTPTTNLDICFPEYEIAIESEEIQPETSKGKMDEKKLEAKELREFQKMAAEGKTGTFQDIPDAELDKYAQEADTVDDKHFTRFKNATSNEPTQVLRYKRTGTPLWIADVEKTVAAQLANIPKCKICRLKREFEFQIMPQMLTWLKDDNLDWGVLVVYTCPKNCKISKGADYATEYIVKQDIVAENK